MRERWQAIWAPLEHYNATQEAYWNSKARFITAHAGRRSGKSLIAKRRLVKAATQGTPFEPSRYFCGAPTRPQAKAIFWNDIKAMVTPARQKALPTSQRKSETELVVRFLNNHGTISEIWLHGLDQPERIEGSPWDGCIIDEIANCKPHTWPMHVRPALSTPERPGFAMLIGVPEGRNHYYRMVKAAEGDVTGTWANFHWLSEEVLSAKEIEAAKRELDPLVYEQEYAGSFVSFTGRAYYGFERSRNCAPLDYDPALPLGICFDFNVSPGVACVLQEQAIGTAVIGEVWIPRNSTTEMVCNRLLADWGHHEGEVYIYGDATGARSDTRGLGSDWSIIERELKPMRPTFRVPAANPTERSRVNAVNSRFSTGRAFIDPDKAPHLVQDLEEVVVVEGGSGEIDYKTDKMLTHSSSAYGYCIAWLHPIDRPRTGLIHPADLEAAAA